MLIDITTPVQIFFFLKKKKILQNYTIRFHDSFKLSWNDFLKFLLKIT